MVKYINCPKCNMSFSATDKELDQEHIECPYCKAVIKIRKPPLSFGQNIDHSEQGNTQYLPSVPVKTEVEKIAEQREIEEKAQEWVDQTNKKINKDRRIIASLVIFSVALGLILAAWGMIINK